MIALRDSITVHGLDADSAIDLWRACGIRNVADFLSSLGEAIAELEAAEALTALKALHRGGIIDRDTARRMWRARKKEGTICERSNVEKGE